MKLFGLFFDLVAFKGLWLARLAALSLLVGCGDSAVADRDAGRGDATPDAAASCYSVDQAPGSSLFPLDDDDPGVSNGRIDAAVEVDPNTGRIWMIYSGVAGGPGTGEPFRISQRLAHSDDNGASWCDDGVVVPVEDIDLGDCPAQTVGPCHLNQEVGSLVYVPSAPKSIRWKHFWFMVTANPANNYPLSWHMVKEAASPSELAAAPARKIFVGKNYEFPAVKQWIDRWPAGSGPPETVLSQLDAELDDCINFTEMGTELVNGTLYMSLVCFGASNRAVLLSTQDPALRGWEYLGWFLGPADAALAHPDASNVSATDLFLGSDDSLRIVVSPEDQRYLGCAVYVFEDPGTATLRDANFDGSPDIEHFQPRPASSAHAGMCTYTRSSTATGLLFAQQHPAFPQMRLLTTGRNF